MEPQLTTDWQAGAFFLALSFVVFAVMFWLSFIVAAMFVGIEKIKEYYQNQE
jgi:hypothetical protein